MATRKPKSKTATTDASVLNPNITLDSFSNATAAMGHGANNQMSNSHYGFNPVTRNRLELEWAYRGNWVVANAVALPAEDMCRNGITVQNIDIDQQKLIDKAFDKLGIWSSLIECIKWARLYGGCLGYLMIDGQDASTPLNINSIGPGQFKGILPFNRWQANPSIGDVVTDLGKDYGLPRYYEIIGDDNVSAEWVKVHHSRVIRFIGESLPFYQKQAENGWGESVIERIFDRLVAYDSVTTGVAQLAYKAHLRTLKIKDLRQVIAAGGEALAGLTAQIAFLRTTQSNEGLTVLDTDDEFDTHQYAFGGMTDLLQSFAEQLSGALQIPLTRLLGQSPGGLNTDGDSSLHTYYDNLGKQQELRLREPIGKILRVLTKSIFGDESDDIDFLFNNLYPINEVERSDIEAKDTDTIIKAYTAGLISKEQAISELKNPHYYSRLFNNLDDNDNI